MPYVRSSLGQRIRASFARSGFAYPTGAAKPPPYLITEDAGTVAHIYFDGSKLVDTKGNSWVMDGVVQQVAASAPVPAGAGAFSSTDYKLGTGSDVLDFTGDWHAIVIFKGTSSGANRIASDGDQSTVGWELLAGNAAAIRTWPTATIVSAGASAVNVPNVLYAGRTGTTLIAKINLGTYTTVTGATIAAATSSIAYIGRSGGAYYGSVVYEILWSSSAPSSGEATSVIAALRAALGNPW